MRGKVLRNITKSVILLASALTFVSAVVMLSIGVSLSNAPLITFATAAIPACLAAAAAIFGVETWADARAAALDEKARDALERFIATSTTIVLSGLNLEGVDLPMRANIATWGSPALLRKMGERTMFIDSLGKEFGEEIARARELTGDPKAAVTIDLGDRKAQLALLTAEAVALARRDIGLSAVSSREMYDALYGIVNGRRFHEVPPL